MKKFSFLKEKIPAMLIYAFAIFWGEFFLALLTGSLGTSFLTLGCALASVSMAALLAIFTAFFKKRGFQFAFTAIATELLTIIYIIQYFCNDAYSAFMSIESIFVGAGGVATGFSDVLLTIATKGLPYIILFHAPFILLIVFRISFKTIAEKGKSILISACCFVAALAVSIGILRFGSGAENYTYLYNFDQGVRNFGFITSQRLDFEYAIFGMPDAPFIPEEEEEEQTGETEEETQQEEPVVYGKHSLYNFAELLENATGTIKEILTIAKSTSESSKNQYTGMFQGKNLVLICAESFSKGLIDEERTPTLYRMATKGINFNNFYQPTWGASTTTGEASLLLGVIPTDGASTMQKVLDKNNGYTIGSQLQKLGYKSIAYHNGTSEYYNRENTHIKLGYDLFIARGTGMEGHVKAYWPSSDLEMMEWTASQYASEEPFNIYYMTISGHGLYSFSSSNMARKNQAVVEDLDASEPVKAYIAANMEFEYALEYLVNYLDECGTLQDTVFVICPDHYPYPLQKGTSWGNDEDYLLEYYGHSYEDQYQRDENALIIWSPCLEESDPIVIDEPVYSVDILPTLYNLFGIEYDSRLMVGRDALGSDKGFVVWANGSWLTSEGYYSSTLKTFTQFNENEYILLDTYLEKYKAKAANKLSLSKKLINSDFYQYLEDLD